jgi:transposase-like protein
MLKSDITCPECSAGYSRIELATRRGAKGEFCCLTCGELLEVFDGSHDVAIRLTVQPTKRKHSRRHGPVASTSYRCS